MEAPEQEEEQEEELEELAPQPAAPPAAAAASSSAPPTDLFWTQIEDPLNPSTQSKPVFLLYAILRRRNDLQPYVTNVTGDFEGINLPTDRRAALVASLRKLVALAKAGDISRAAEDPPEGGEWSPLMSADFEAEVAAYIAAAIIFSTESTPANRMRFVKLALKQQTNPPANPPAPQQKVEALEAQPMLALLAPYWALLLGKDLLGMANVAFRDAITASIDRAVGAMAPVDLPLPEGLELDAPATAPASNPPAPPPEPRPTEEALRESPVLKTLLANYALAFMIDDSRANGGLGLLAPDCPGSGDVGRGGYIGDVARATVAKQRLEELRTSQEHLHAHRFHNWANKTTMGLQTLLEESTSAKYRSEFFGKSSKIDVVENALSIRHPPPKPPPSAAGASKKDAKDAKKHPWPDPSETPEAASADYELRRWEHLLNSTIRRMPDPVTLGGGDDAASMWKFVQKLLVARNGFRLSSHHATDGPCAVRTASILDDDHYCMVDRTDMWVEAAKTRVGERPHDKFPHVMGANSLADRLFVNRGFLTAEEVRLIAERVRRAKHARKGWWDDDASLSRLRMGRASHERFRALRDEFETLVSCARRTDTSDAAMDEAVKATSKRSPFGHALLDFKFLHLRDMALDDAHAYTADDLLMHAFDAHRRVQTFIVQVRSQTDNVSDPLGRLGKMAEKLANVHSDVARSARGVYGDLAIGSVEKTQSDFKLAAHMLSRNVNLLVAAQLHWLASRPNAPRFFKYVVLGGAPSAAFGENPPPSDHVFDWKARIEDARFGTELRSMREGVRAELTDAERRPFERLEEHIGLGKKLLHKANELDMELEFILRCGKRLLKHATTDVRQRDAHVVGFVTRPLADPESGDVASHSGTTDVEITRKLEHRLGLRGGYGERRRATSRIEVLGDDTEYGQVGIARGTLMPQGYESNLRRGWADAPTGTGALSGVQRLWAERAAGRMVNVTGFVGQADALARALLTQRAACLYNLPHWSSLIPTHDAGQGPFDAPPGEFASAVRPDLLQKACVAVCEALGQETPPTNALGFAEAAEYVDVLPKLYDPTDNQDELTKALRNYITRDDDVRSWSILLKNTILNTEFSWKSHLALLNKERGASDGEKEAMRSFLDILS